MCGWSVRGPRELRNMNSELRKKTEKRVAPNEPTLRAKGRPGMGRGRKDEVQRTKDERGWSADQEKEQRFDRLPSVRARRVEDTAGELRDTHYEAPAANHQPPLNSHQKDQWPNKPICHVRLCPAMRTSRFEASKMGQLACLSPLAGEIATCGAAPPAEMPHFGKILPKRQCSTDCTWL